jgi:hypothetical protein
MPRLSFGKVGKRLLGALGGNAMPCSGGGGE